MEVVDETILNVDLITELVKVIISGNSISTHNNSKRHKLKSPVSKVHKVEAALMKELGQAPPPPPPPANAEQSQLTNQSFEVVPSEATDGAILIFVDGFQAIRDLIDAFTADPVLGILCILYYMDVFFHLKQ